MLQLQAFIFCLFLISQSHSQIFDPIKSPYMTRCPSSNKVVNFGPFQSSPYDFKPFQQVFQNPQILKETMESCVQMNNKSHCIKAFTLKVYEFKKQLCPVGKPATWFLGYNGQVPGPMIKIKKGVESVVRLINKVNGTFFHENQFCGRKGHGINIHNHGAMTLPVWNGWPEDIICNNEYKDYQYPNNQAKLNMYYDNSLHASARNRFYGLTGLYDIIDDTPSIIPEMYWMLQDYLMDKECQLLIDPLQMHSAYFYGDIMTINGIPWPKINVNSSSYIINIANPSISRTYVLIIKDEIGNVVQHKLCNIVGSDGGTTQTSINISSIGLFVSVGERYKLSCDFSRTKSKTLYVMNSVDVNRQIPIPVMFCKSHLIARIDIQQTRTASNMYYKHPLLTRPSNLPKSIINDSVYNIAINMANKQRAHRRFDLTTISGMWLVNDNGWMLSDKFVAKDIKRDTWEVWRLRTDNANWHSIHINLVNFICLRRNQGPCYAQEQGAAKDVIHIDPGDEVYILVKMGPHVGSYMFGCGNAIHQDNDMMLAYNITSSDTLYTIPRNYTDPLGIPPQSISKMPLLNTSYLYGMLKQNVYKVFYPDCKVDCHNNPWKVI